MRNRFLIVVAIALCIAGSGVITVPARAYVRAPVVSVSEAVRGRGVDEFRLIGIRSGSSIEGLELRTSTDGEWGPWEALERAAGPDRGNAEAARPDVEVSEPVWVDGADGWQIRGAGADEAQVLVVREAGPRVELPARRPAASARASAAPPVHSRGEWGARAPKTNPSYASTVKMAFVHHTVNSNTYAASDVPSMLRAIQAYHMDANGWDDIAYNTLVDRFGGIWEGRGGGLDRTVIGAHTSGFNTGSTGVAVLGEFGTVAPSAAAAGSVAEWLAWKLPLTSVDPQGSATMTSGGNERYPKDAVVTFPAIAGHREARPTACPGQQFYDRLGNLRADTASRVGLAVAYPGFDGGVWVTSAQLDSDPAEEVVTGADAGGGPHVRVFDANGSARDGFFAFGGGNRGGVRVAAGNVDALGVDEVITATGPGDAPQVRVTLENGSPVSSFQPYAGEFRGGVYVASGNVDGLPGDEIITGPGPGGGPHVRIIDGTGREVGGFFAYAPGFSGGVRVATGDVDGDGVEEIITGPGSGGGPHVRAFRVDGSEVGGFMAYDPRFASGVYVGSVAQGVGNPALVVTGAGEGGGPHVRLFTIRGSERSGFMAGFPNSGVRVAGGLLRGERPADLVMTGGPRSLSIVKLAKSDGVGAQPLAGR